MHLAFVSIPGHGHINPTLPLVAELAGRGHRVTYATGEGFTMAVEAAGAIAVALPGGMPRPPARFDPAQLAQLAEGLVEGARAGFPVLLRRLEQDPADAVCFDAMTVVGRMVAEKLNLPDIALHPSFASSENFSLRAEFMAERTRDMPSAYLEAFASVQQRLAEFGRQQGVSGDGLFHGPPASLNIVFIPREFQLAANTFDRRFHFVGPSLGRRASEPWRPPPGIGPLLFISLGTVFNNQLEFFRTCLQAFGNSPWRVAMAIGEQVDPVDLEPIPGNVHVRPYFPQPAVLQHADVFVSHAGMNSTMESLYCSVPLVAVPQMPEQEANARRLEELGLGRRLSRSQSSKELIRTVVDEVQANEAIHANVAQMSEIVRNSGGPVAAADAIERFLEVRMLH